MIINFRDLIEGIEKGKYFTPGIKKQEDLTDITDSIIKYISYGKNINVENKDATTFIISHYKWRETESDPIVLIEDTYHIDNKVYLNTICKSKDIKNGMCMIAGKIFIFNEKNEIIGIFYYPEYGVSSFEGMYVFREKRYISMFNSLTGNYYTER
jgi:hypothetical protein